MSFQFVENGKIDGPTRKLIRSHVMKGKNVGKTRLQSTRKEEKRGEVHFPDESYYASDLTMSTTTCKSIKAAGETKFISVPSTIGNSLSPFTFPCQIQPYMRDLIYQFVSMTTQAVYPTLFCLPIPVRGQLWFQYLQSDEAFFHSVLAMAEVCVDSRLGRQETSPQALHHLSNTYRCISRNLQKHKIPSNATVAAVMSMAIHEDLRGQPARSKVHIDALERMVELRGGITQFESNRGLLQKICRADIEYALHTGSYPRFNRDEFPRATFQSILGQSIPRKEEVFSVAESAQICDPKLQRVFVDSMDFSRILNDECKWFKMEPYAFQESLISVCGRLLHRYPLASDRFSDDNESSCHLGLLALMTTLLFQHGRYQRLSYTLLAEKLRNAIQITPSSSWLMEETNFRLWLLFVGGISVFDAIDRAWLLPQINACLFTLDIDSWPTARDKIKTFPWIDAIHDKPGHELWQAVAERIVINI